MIGAGPVEGHKKRRYCRSIFSFEWLIFRIPIRGFRLKISLMEFPPLGLSS